MHYLFKLKYVFAIGIFVLAIGFVGESSIVNRLSQKAEIAKLQGEIDSLERKFQEDKEVVTRLKRDNEAIKDVARERYFMKTPNEDVFVIEE